MKYFHARILANPSNSSFAYINAASDSNINYYNYIWQEKINSLFEDKKNLSDFNQLGMNLNLNIAKKLINAHNWKIIAQSKENNSSTFGFVVQK